jgi:predicted Fe-Mo cluster-binding NifX family protein
MKIAISAVEPIINAPFDARFGRCAYFIFVDAETHAWKASPNPALTSGGGAGTQAAQFIAGQGAQAVVSSSFGPNAYEALVAAGIKMYSARAGLVENIFEDFASGELEEFSPSSDSGINARHGRHKGARR